MGKIKKFKKEKKENKENPRYQKIDPNKLLPKLLKNDTGVISKSQLSEISFLDIFQLIEEISSFVIANPEKNLIHLQTIFHLTEWDEIVIVKAALLSAVEIFKNICPLYQIDNEKIHEALQQKISKDDKMLLNYEKNLLEFYEKYLGILSSFSRLKSVSVDNEKENQEQIKTISDLRYTAIKCLCEIINHLSHFNYIDKVVGYTIKKITNFHEKTKETVLNAIKSVFCDPAHSLYPIKIQMLKEIIKIINKTSEDKLPDKFIDVVNLIEFDTKAEKVLKLEADQKKENKKAKREHFREKFKEKNKNKDENSSNKQKKTGNEEKKLKKEINNEMKESMGDMETKLIAKYNAEILSKLFGIYFKILKRPCSSKFFNSCLNGIMKFVHLVNINLISAITESLNETAHLIRNTHLKKQKTLLLTRLTTLYSFQEIIRVQGSLIEVDEKGMIKIFYQILLDTIKNQHILNEYTQNEKQIFVKLIEKIFIEKRQFSMETVASFIKLTSKFSLQMIKDHHFCSTLLFIIYKLLNKYPKMLNLLDSENDGIGLNMFNESIDDPQATNALNCNIIGDMDDILNKTTNAEVKYLASKIKKGEKISNNLISLSPLQFYSKTN